MFFTVFTPTFNRAHTLARVFDSLKAQTWSDFEWLVVDDGSTDDTQVLLKKFQAQASFPMRIFLQPNAGKHVAWNRAVREARGRFFLVLDSDDACVPTALERFAWGWRRVARDERIVAIVSLCKDTQGRVVGSRFPLEVSDHVTLALRYGLWGEKWECYRTDILINHPFPEWVRGVLPESFLLNRLSRRYLFFYMNEPLRIYYQDTTSLTRQRDPRRHSQGQILVHQEFLNLYGQRFFENPAYFFLSALKLTRHAVHAGRGLWGPWQGLKPLGRFLWFLTLIPAMLTLFWERWSRSTLSGCWARART